MSKQFSKSFGSGKYPQKKEEVVRKEITEGKDYVENAELVMKSLKGSSLTTSKIRKLLSLINSISEEVKLADEELNKRIIDNIKYLKVRFVYEAGREKSVKDFITTAGIIRKLDEIDGKEKFMEFSRYMEALVAYHRYFDGRDS